MIIIKLTLTEIQKHQPCADGVALFKHWYGKSCEIEWTPLWQIMCSVSDAKEFYIWLACRGLVPFYNLIHANLRDANLRDANLRDANLRNADLSNANLRDANLRNADLSNANLRDADLSNADLSNADLSNADLSNADLSNADLRDANLRDALHNEHTQWPDGFDKSQLTR